MISGTVRDEHGTPLEGQLVLVTRTDGSQLPSGLMQSPVDTDAIGRFRIFGLPSGTYAVKARRTSGTFIENAPLSNEVRVSVSAGEERGGIELRLPPLTVSGQR